MKKLYIFSFLIILSAGNLFSQSGWFWQNPLPLGTDVRSFQFLNSLTGYGVTYGGAVFKTTNAGQTWISYATNDTRMLLSSSFLNENTGYVVGQKAKVEKTTDGGNSWTTINFPFYPTQFLRCVQFLDVNTGFVGGDYGVYNTTNAGSSWNSIGYFYSFELYFLNANTGISIGSFPYTLNIRRTTDGGLSWFSVYSLNSSPSNVKISFVDENTGYVAAGILLKTTNSGLNWVTIHTPDVIGGYYSCKFLNSNTGFILGSNNFIGRTINGGVNWDTVKISSNNSLSIVNFSDINHGVLMGNSGSVVYTTNSGINWTNISFGNNTLITGIQFLNEQTGYAAGWNRYFAKTTNGGVNWIESLISQSYIYPHGGLFFLNALTGFVVSANKAVFKTTNGGVTWDSSFVPGSNDNLTRIKFINQTTGFITGVHGNIYKTTNQGINWILNYQIQGPVCRDIAFVNINTGFVCTGGYGSPILKTTNCGLSWDTSQTNIYLVGGICFTNENTGYAVGSNGTILKSTNTGNNWFLLNSGTIQDLTRVLFTDENTGYIVGYSGEMLKTTNSGNSWNKLIPLTNYELQDMYFFDNYVGYIVGNGGNILKTTTGGTFVGVQSTSTQIPQSFSLHQNYPNPFNPVTKIKFDIPLAPLSFGEGLGVRLIIYDLLGREITTLVNEQLKPGTYEVDWDGTGFASGVYFYSLVTSDFVETKRMVLIK